MTERYIYFLFDTKSAYTFYRMKIFLFKPKISSYNKWISITPKYVKSEIDLNPNSDVKYFYKT